MWDFEINCVIKAASAVYFNATVVDKYGAKLTSTDRLYHTIRDKFWWSGAI